MKLSALLLGSSLLVFAGSPELERAQKLYNLTRFEESLKVLQEVPQKDADVWSLTGRNYYMIGEYKKATEALEKAAAAAPADSQVALWLGRAFGRRAETSLPITAPGHASKARHWFERSVELNPKNSEALSDLFEYYLEAPGFLGGGYDKAQGIASRMGQIDAAEGHWAQAKLAEKKKEYKSAEDQLRRAIDASPHRVGRLIDLARFLAKQGRYQEAHVNLAQAEKLGPDSPKVVYAKADLLIQEKKDLQLAKTLLKQYLTMNLSPEDPSRSDAKKLLKQVEGS
jgi:tetratricopeptide (TPR) repeat protein